MPSFLHAGLLGLLLTTGAHAATRDVGCSPGYWKNHPDTWASTPYAPEEVFDDVFGTTTFGDATLMEVLWQGGGCEDALGRHAVAGILNASYGNGYPISDPDEVVSLVAAALQTGDCSVIDALKDTLDEYNNACHDQGCAVHTYCNPSTGNENNTSTIQISGCDLLAPPVTVDLAGAPSGQFAYLLIGDGNQQSKPFRSDGELCLNGGACLGRYVLDVGVIGADGTFSTDISNSTTGGPDFGIPNCGGHITSGETWNFQYWHRKQGAGQHSTFSEALTVTFQ